MNNTILKTKNDFEVIPLEKCIVCNIETNVPVSEHVDHRNYYIEGAGQLCKECFESVNSKKYISIG